MTLDKFLNPDRNSSSNQKKKMEQITSVIPVQLMSVKKLIYNFEIDSDPALQKVFRKHYYVGFL